MKLVAYTIIFLTTVLSNKANALCKFLKPDYNQIGKDQYILKVDRNQNGAEYNNYKCYISEEFSYKLSYMALFKCSEKISIRFTTNEFNNEREDIWDLVDKKQNPFMLRVVDYVDQYHQEVKDDCSKITQDIKYKFVFDKEEYYPEKADFYFMVKRKYKIKEDRSINPEF